MKALQPGAGKERKKGERERRWRGLRERYEGERERGGKEREGGKREVPLHTFLPMCITPSPRFSFLHMCVTPAEGLVGGRCLALVRDHDHADVPADLALPLAARAALKELLKLGGALDVNDVARDQVEGPVVDGLCRPVGGGWKGWGGR